MRVLRAARDAGARRVVLTSSFAAVGYSPKAGPRLHRGGLDRPRYARPAALPALQGDRRACRLGLHRDRRRRHPAGGGEPDIHRRPVAGGAAALVAEPHFKAIIEGTMPALPRQRFGVVDVRDVADAHIKAMATPAAAGKRLPAAGGRPDDHLAGAGPDPPRPPRPAGEHVTTDEAPGRGAVAADDPQRPRQARSSAGAHARPRPRSSRPPRACATSACCRNDDDEL